MYAKFRLKNSFLRNRESFHSVTNLNIIRPLTVPQQHLAKISNIMQQLDKQKALELIPLIVDDEVGPELRRAFFEYIKNHAAIRKQYESQKKIKELVQNHYKQIKAPDHLRQKIQLLINREENNEVSGETLYLNSPAQLSGEQDSQSPNGIHPEHQSHSKTFYRLTIAAAAVILLSILTIGMLDRVSPVFDSTLSVEEFAFSHFSESDGSLSFAGWQPGSLTDAQRHLIDEYDVDIRLPIVRNAELTNVFYTDFVPDYKTPILEYYQEEVNEYIYIFAFKIDHLTEFSRLARDPEAVEKCKSSDDFHVKDIQGTHVVSWKWEDNWYAAISNHNGDTLAAIIEPMNGLWND